MRAQERDVSTDTQPPPDLCPFCRASEITTTSRSSTPSTYWRCTKCGQIWNAGRLRTWDGRRWR
jgi:ribosomal protein L37AE/L43A